MGCKSSTMKEADLCLNIKSSIDADNYKALAAFLTALIKMNQNPGIVDFHIIEHDNITFSALAYAVYKGKSQCSLYLYKVFKANYLELINTFHCQNLDPIIILCTFGYLDILKLFFPIHHEMKEASDCCTPSSSVTPIQCAVKYGHITIIEYFVNYFKPSPPPSYDINYTNFDGENCATIALKEGNYIVLRFIIEKCGGKIQGMDDPLDFCLTMSLSNPEKGYLEIIMYLVQALHYSVFKHHLDIPHNNPILARFLNSKYSNNVNEIKEIKESLSTNYSL